MIATLAEHQDLLFALALALALMALHALFVLADVSLIKLQYTRFPTGEAQQLKEKPSVQRLLSRMGEISRVIRLGMISCTLGLGFVVILIVGEILEDFLPDLAQTGRILTFLAVFLFTLILHSLLAVMIPQAVGLRYTARALSFSSWLVRLFRLLSLPLTRFTEKLGSFILPLFRIQPGHDAELIDAEMQIRSLVSDGEELSPLTERILSNALRLKKLVIQDVLLPRNQIQFFDIHDPLEYNLEIATQTGHTRFPLCDGDLDKPLGLIHIKDIFRYRGDRAALDLRTIKREIARFTPDDPLDLVLQRLLKSKLHMALVADEFGGTVGAITLEDILEELVGDIQDEFDREEDPIKETAEEEFLVDGLTPIHDLSERLNLPLSDEEVSTFGGLITSELGRLPNSGESFQIGRLYVTAESVDEKRVLMARVRILPPAEEETANA